MSNFADTRGGWSTEVLSTRGFLEEYLEKFHEWRLANCEHLLLARRNLPWLYALLYIKCMQRRRRLSARAFRGQRRRKYASRERMIRTSVRQEAWKLEKKRENFAGRVASRKAANQTGSCDLRLLSGYKGSFKNISTYLYREDVIGKVIRPYGFRVWQVRFIAIMRNELFRVVNLCGTIL